MTLKKDPGRIRRMFAEISPRYDFLNHFLSLNVDRRWRRHAVKALGLAPRALVLDICTGTADLALELDQEVRRSGGRVVGSDFTPEMLWIGETKRRRCGASSLRLVAADSLALPFREGSFDAVTVAFGIRNVCDLNSGLREMLRVLKPGGQAAILEFSPPENGMLRHAFEVYFRKVLPAIGRWVSGSRAYAYLPESVSEFPSVPRFGEILGECGFDSVTVTRLTLGVAVLHIGRKPAVIREPAFAGGRA